MQQDRDDAPAAPSKKRGGRPLRHRDDPGILAAIAATGSIGALASAAGVTTGAVSIWKRIPARVVPTLAAAICLSKHALRPDLFDADDQPIPSQPKEK